MLSSGGFVAACLQVITKGGSSILGETRKFQKRPPIGREGVYDENSDFIGKKTNRIEKKHKVYWLLLSQISSDSFRKHTIL